MPPDDRRHTLSAMQQTHHSRAFRQRLEDGTVEVWFAQDNADTWGNMLSLRVLEPAFAALAPCDILTLGDGKGAKEARFFQQLGHRALATDICTEVLEEAQRRGLIAAYAREDAEALSFADGSFDFVVVKETLHHLQRPYLAIYEMLRVARVGAVIIEPHIHQPLRGLRVCVRYLVRRLLRVHQRRQPPPPTPLEYEPAGNLVYRFSAFDLSQCAAALGAEYVAFHYAHAYYEEGCERIAGTALEDLIRRKTAEMARYDATHGVDARPLLVFLIFKRAIPEPMREPLRRAGFCIPERLRNPAFAAIEPPDS